jgi:DNA-binding LacI/PurR family transcriptional regulator
MSDLHDDLLSIDGVGEATAHKVQEVCQQHGYGEPSDELAQNLRQAIDYYDAGNYEYAGKYLKRAEELI